MTTDISSIRAEVAELSDKDLILEVVKAIGWTVSEGGHYATKHDGSRFMLADPRVFGRCMLTSTLDMTSDRVSWAALNEVVWAAWKNLEHFQHALKVVGWTSGVPDRIFGLTIKPRQVCECIAVARRMNELE